MSIIIVGGGMAGATLALAISYFTSGELLVHLVEAKLPQNINHPGFDTRAIALAQGIYQQLISYINVQQEISSYITPIHSIQISDRGHAGFITLEAHDYNIDALGQVIELHNFGIRLFNLLKITPGVIMHCPSQVVNFTRSKSSVKVMLDNGETLDGQLLVAADGSRSEIATQCGIAWQQQSYNQIAMIANVATAINHNSRAWERFTEQGPLAMLPISKGRCSLVWCHAQRNIENIMSWSNEHFCAELQKVFGWRLGRIISAENRIIYPLTLTIATRSISHRVVVVGNAAQTVHPIAGQGFNLGLRDVISLARTLEQAWSKQQDCGAYSVLNYYQHLRQLDRTTIINITDGLVRFFTSHHMPLIAGRNIGLMAMELLIPVCNILVKHALGWSTY